MVLAVFCSQRPLVKQDPIFTGVTYTDFVATHLPPLFFILATIPNGNGLFLKDNTARYFDSKLIPDMPDFLRRISSHARLI